MEHTPEHTPTVSDNIQDSRFECIGEDVYLVDGHTIHIFYPFMYFADGGDDITESPRVSQR